MKSANIRETTMIDYRSKVKNHIIEPLGDMKILVIFQQLCRQCGGVPVFVGTAVDK